MEKVNIIQHDWGTFSTAVTAAVVWAAIVVTLYCFQDFIKYLRSRYFR